MQKQTDKENYVLLAIKHATTTKAISTEARVSYKSQFYQLSIMQKINKCY
jgi:hypothetical protein